MTAKITQFPLTPRPAEPTTVDILVQAIERAIASPKDEGERVLADLVNTRQ